MKTAIALVFFSLALASTSANAFFFFFLPGSVVSKIGDAITGSEGENCVSNSAKVGDTIRLENGATAKIKSLSGTSGRCTKPELPIRALLDVLSDPPVANSVVSSKASINLPDGWEAKTLTTAQKNAGVLFMAVNRTIDTGLMLASYKREGITDMLTYVTTKRGIQANLLNEPQIADIIETAVNGDKAWRFEVTGLLKTSSHMKLTYQTTVIDVGSNEILTLNAWTGAANYDRQKQSMAELASAIGGFSKSPPSIAETPAPASADKVLVMSGPTALTQQTPLT